jgi:hypothetical protein
MLKAKGREHSAEGRGHGVKRALLEVIKFEAESIKD